MVLGLTGKKVVITGATRGIGLAIAEEFLAEGCKVSICARDENSVASTLARFNANGNAAYGKACNVKDKVQLQEFVRYSAECMGGLDVLVSNVSAASGSWQDCFDIDMMGAVNSFEAALPYLKQSDCAAVTAISSRAALTGAETEDASYHAIKLSLISYMKSLAVIYGACGIRANAVSPGDIYFEGGVWHRISVEYPDVFSGVKQDTPLGRLGTPGEIAKVVVFVSSPAASFMSGANILVDGARTRGI